MKKWNPAWERMQKHWGKVCVYVLLTSSFPVQGIEQGSKASDELSIEFLEYLVDQNDNEPIDPLVLERMIEKEGKQQVNDE